MAIIVMAGICLAADKSQPPAPTPTKSGEQQQAKASESADRPAEIQPGTEQLPLVIKGYPSVESEEDAAHKTYEHHEKPTLDRWLTASTVALAVFTLLLFGATFLMWVATYKLAKSAEMESRRRAVEMTDSLAIARTSADAASKSADVAEKTLKLTQRGFIGFSNFVVKGLQSNKQPEKFSFLTKNVGNTTIDMTGVVVRQRVARNVSELPSTNNLIAEKCCLPLGPRQDCGMPVNTAEITNDELADVLSGKKFLWFYGYAEYRDIFGELHRSGFCVQYDHKSGALQIDAPSDHNYAT